MKNKKNKWILLSEEENKFIWDNILNKLNFNPSYKERDNIKLNANYKIYDVDEIIKQSANLEKMKKFYNKIESIFVKCMEKDEYMYALEWQSSGIKLNPRVYDETTWQLEPVFIKDSRFEWGGYNLYFPKYYPDGDYYFFVAKDLRWGYLTHLTEHKIYVFGEMLINEIDNNVEELKFTLI